jgi:hypothetical protein
VVVATSVFIWSVAGAAWAAPGDAALVCPVRAKGDLGKSALSANGRLVRLHRKADTLK